MKRKLKIMLVEDHPEFRETVEMILGSSADYDLISQFGSADQALRSLQSISTRIQPDLILLDLNLPGLSGLDALPYFKSYLPDANVIILTQSNKEADVLQAIREGAAGYLLKSSTMDQLMQGIKTVSEGGSTIDSSLARFIMDTLRSQLPEEADYTELSKREMEILQLLSEGLVKKEIAGQLNIGFATVATHIRHIYEKLQVENAPAAVHRGHKLGLFRKTK
ncbi:response regulator transcription factor [Pontiellaceae bacterium B12227]|nr:response regulator transcription factor [Pontiellaceae bacterium B12227]